MQNNIEPLQRLLKPGLMSHKELRCVNASRTNQDCDWVKEKPTLQNHVAHLKRSK
jgi:hypothetical protein